MPTRTQWLNRELIAQTVAKSTSHTECLKTLGLNSTSSGNFQTLKKYILKYSLSYKHFTHHPIEKTNHPNFDPLNKKDVFIKNSTASTSTIRKIILKHSIIPYFCSNCDNNGVWNRLPLTLQLDHINGDKHNHQLKNLRWLCPNCHTQTPTHCIGLKKQTNTKNKPIIEKRKSRYVSYPPLNKLIKMLKFQPYTKVAKELNCHHYSIKKYLIKNNINPITLECYD